MSRLSHCSSGALLAQTLISLHKPETHRKTDANKTERQRKHFAQTQISLHKTGKHRKILANKTERQRKNLAAQCLSGTPSQSCTLLKATRASQTCAFRKPFQIVETSILHRGTVQLGVVASFDHTRLSDYFENTATTLSVVDLLWQSVFSFALGCSGTDISVSDGLRRPAYVARRFLPFIIGYIT
jgi:hypothetical protein